MIELKPTSCNFQNISMLIPDFYEIVDLVEDSMPLPPVEEDKLSVLSKDSGRNSSRSSSKGTFMCFNISFLSLGNDLQ